MIIVEPLRSSVLFLSLICSIVVHQPGEAVATSTLCDVKVKKASNSSNSKLSIVNQIKTEIEVINEVLLVQQKQLRN